MSPRPRGRTNDEFLALRIPKGLKKALQQLADEDKGRPLPNYVRMVLSDHVEDKKKRK